MKKYLVPFTALFLSIGLVGCNTNNPVKEDEQHAQEETKNVEEQRHQEAEAQRQAKEKAKQEQAAKAEQQQNQEKQKQLDENDSSNQSAPKIEGPESERFKEEQIRKLQAADPKEKEEAFDRAAASRRERFERQEIEKMDCDTARSALSQLEKMDDNPIAKKQALDYQDKIARCNKVRN
ncbi:hypothetical protein COE61_27380 [Bacillus thuringiensis]|uniref:hypothetical protein n=1 Tax=Bacillus thuringiensis TaxID=1428 RepID=UPI000BEBEC44|nr:hypothetical protein [Bacillus thuringiensis]PDX91021.1 hypothetical protein COM78_31330 [Bacillus thuringiensis]PER45908.1 hypothetical protein CN486_31230 [Bacillus thuringiensis]PGZ66651.1 hypothetical protein COE61_27380 [Bacillus thuringiensis]